jgi:ATPase subunit of ABC transporter with duplicated ATPase domains
VVGDRRAQGQGGRPQRRRARQERARARTERSEKQAAKVRATEKAIERLEAVEKPWRRWELQLRFGGGERSGDVTARLEGAELRRGPFALGPLDLELGWGSASRSSGRTAAARRRSSTRCSAGAAGGGHALGRPRRARGTLDQARAGFDGATPLIDTFVEQSGLSLQEARSLLATLGLDHDAVARVARSCRPASARARASRC